MQAFQPPAAAATAGATDVIGATGSQLNAVCGMRNTLLVAADSVTDAMSSLVKELSSGLYGMQFVRCWSSKSLNTQPFNQSVFILSKNYESLTQDMQLTGLSVAAIITLHYQFSVRLQNKIEQ